MAWEVYMWTRCGCSCVMDAEYMARVVTSFVRELCRILRWLNMICVALSPRMLKGVGFFIVLVGWKRSMRRGCQYGDGVSRVGW